MSVSLGCLLRSAFSLMSRGSNAILCPFSPASYEVSGAEEYDAAGLGAGEDTRLFSLLSPFSVDAPPPPAPRRRVRPEPDAEAILKK